MSCTSDARISAAVRVGCGAGGGGGGGGTVTSIVTVRLSEPPGPFAARVYVVVLPGETVRLPLLCTAPMPWSMVISVAFWVAQFNVADCPRSIVRGSPVKLVITGFAGGGGGNSCLGGGGGGGAGA